MKKKYFKKVTILLVLFYSTLTFSQNSIEKKKITKSYNIDKLNQLKQQFFKKAQQLKKEALEKAKINGWEVKFIDKHGSYHELMGLTPEGKPLYYKTDNTNAAISTRANWLHSGGGLSLNIEGQGMTAYVWDGGLARTTHQEYDGIGGNNRYSIGDGSTALSFHGAHVTGTIMASGVNSNAKGMAPQSKVIGHDRNSDEAEATNAATNGMLLSNHSYGYSANDIPDWWFGAYTSDAVAWDEILYNAPYYLIVLSAGNDGNNSFSNGDPLEGDSFYDKLNGNKTSKNSLVVANGLDATINTDGSLISAGRNSGSSEGPTDDLRIKPDIMGNGTNLISTYETSDSAYGTISGTSMSSPNVCGSLLLLQQYYNETYGNFMLASTLKGLALHTTDDVADVGPDAETGWGLMNTKAAAETITNNGLQSWISEETLAEGQTFTMTVQSDGINPLLASISWTDPAGTANTGISNDNTPALVNDLDLRVTQTGTDYLPWKLISVSSNDKGDNLVDPYERVDITGASGEYTITVNHKGNMSSGPQNFSIIITGVSSDFTFNTSNISQSVCSNNDAIFNFDYEQIGGGTTNFSISGMPTGMTGNFSPPSLSSDDAFTVTFGNLTTVTPGTYMIDIIGDNGTETETKPISLTVYHTDFSSYPQPLSSPNNGQTGINKNVMLEWTNNLNAEDYTVEVSTDPSFSSTNFSSTETGLEYNLSNLLSETVYYWRVRPNNNCSNGNFSPVYSFQTGIFDCLNTFVATDFSDANITTFAGDTASVGVNVSTSGSIITEVITNFEINHTWVNDLKISLEGPTAISNLQVLLFESSCTTDTGGDSNPGDGNNFDVTYSDAGSSLFCDDVAVPSITGTILPLEPLSNFSDLMADGDWTLRIEDPHNGDGGDIISFSVDVCVLESIMSVINFTNTGLINVNANSTYTILTSDIEATTTSETPSQQVYILIELPAFGSLEKNAISMAVGDTFTQEDINSGVLSFSNTQTNAFSDQFKVNILNATNGWLPNQIVLIDAVLATSQLSHFNNLKVWPNPTKETLNIQFNTLLNDDIKIDFSDVIGRQISNSQFTSQGSLFNKEIVLKEFSNGIYLMTITQGGNKITKRILISD